MHGNKKTDTRAEKKCGCCYHRDEQVQRQRRHGSKPGFVFFLFFFSFLQTSTVKAFDVIIHTQAVSLAETLFKSTVRNAPLMDSAHVSICINGLLLTPTKPSMEPAMGLSCQAKNWAVNICVECGGRPLIFFGTISADFALANKIFRCKVWIADKDTLTDSWQCYFNNKVLLLTDLGARWAWSRPLSRPQSWTRGTRI